MQGIVIPTVRELIKRSDVIGITRGAAKEMISDVVKWAKYSGPSFAVNKLKDLKINLLRQQALLEPLPIIFKKNRRGAYKGAWGWLFNYASKGEREFNQALQFLMMYTVFTSSELTEEQVEKFTSAVNCPLCIIPEDICRSLEKTTEEYVGQQFVDPLAVTPLLLVRGSPAKSSPIFKNGEIKSTKQSEDMRAELSYFKTPMGLSLYEKFRERYSLMMRGIDKWRKLEMTWVTKYGNAPLGGSMPDIEPKHVIVGRVAFLQEPGLKLRAIANPFRIHQIALKPLGDSLFKILKSLPWDCTHDQSKAFPFVQEALRNGKTVHCVDLSSFTDRFPLSLQIRVLNQIFGEDSVDVRLFQFLSQGIWKSKLGWISWSKGQPLGLYPSFAAAGLTHGLLLADLLGNTPYLNQFFVVGDDVVILDDVLNKGYRQILDLLECQVSDAKTLSSNSLAEFAGKIITPNFILPQYKWSSCNDDSFLDIVRNLGKKARSLLMPRQLKVFDMVKNILPPLGLNMPTDPHRTLKEAVYETELFNDAVGLDKKVLGSLVNLAAWLDAKHLYHVQGLGDYLGRDVIKILQTHQRCVLRAFKGTVIENAVRANVYFAEAFPDLPEVTGNPVLPTPEWLPTRLTTLERYERFLNI